MDGTSMATPLSASVAALIWSQNPTWTAVQVRQRLFDSADPIDSLPCNSSMAGKLGAGRINAFKAVGTATPPSPPVADFSASPTSGVAPLDVNFSDQSTGNITSWSWNFGDGYGATLRNPSHRYEFPGTYTVSLTVSGESGSDAETKPDYITVTEPQAQNLAGVTSIGTGIYSRSGKTRIFHPQLDFIQGDEVVIRAQVYDSTNRVYVSNAVVVIGITEITGPEATTLTSGPSDSDGIAEARWKTSAPRGKNSGTTPGSYTATVNNVTVSGYTWDGIRTTAAFTVNSK
jgi:PKD repeat protein